MKRSLDTLLILCASLVSLAAVAAPVIDPTAPLTAAESSALTPSRQQIETGRAVAEQNCAECHGMDGVATDPSRPHLAAQRTIYLHRALQAYQAHERRSDVMNHAAGFLNDEALLAVSAYYSNLAPAPATDAHEAAAAAVKDAGDPFAEIRGSMQKCVKCHGAEGNSSASGMPNLTAQDPDYFVSSMEAYENGTRQHKLMTRMVSDLNEQTISGMAVFYAVQVPVGSDTAADGSASRGKALSEPCAGCHGADGNANGKVPSLAGQDPRYFVKAMTAYKEGSRQNEKMFEAAENLGDGDMADLAAFYAAQEPVRRNVRAPLTASEWMTRCERCHGIDGNSTDPRFPMLAGQNEAYLVTAIQDYMGATRSASAMHAMAEPLTPEDVAQIARHYATRTPKAVVYMQLPCEDAGEP
jgi:cytochrome c553